MSRLEAAAVGLTALACDGLLAAASLGGILAVRQVRLEPVAAASGIILGTVLATYLSFRIGTRR
ncbi:MAG: hypothetical protein ABEI27_07055 [Halobellus sp.]|uniref:hypothetical protein n=1 Tax=Halobellus sp. TaxID=1979212 RepID=UPI0035D40CFF